MNNESKKLKFPAQEEITETLEKVKEILKIKQVNMSKNFGIKEGLTDCVRILQNRIDNPVNRYFNPNNQEDVKKATAIYRDQLKGIDQLKTTEGRAIAVMCVDYLNGKLDQSMILANKELIKMR